MGYLNNQVVTIDAILTKKGRELLARGDGSFKITQFALSDDEIDYNLYNPSHPSGSAFYGEAIENMPLMEAFPDETQIMKHKLVTLPRGTAKMPILDLGQSNISLKQTAEKTITPQTLNYLDNNQVFESSGYIFTISDVRLFSNFVGTGVDEEQSTTLNSTTTLGTNVSKTVIGTSLNMKATGVNTLFGSNTQLQATLTIIGRDSGARIQIPVSVKKSTS
jgi:hypothetical protein